MDSDLQFHKTARHNGGNLEEIDTNSAHNMFQRQRDQVGVGDVRSGSGDVPRYFTCESQEMRCNARSDEANSQQHYGLGLDRPRSGTKYYENGLTDGMRNCGVAENGESEERKLTRKEQLLIWQQQKDEEQTRSSKPSAVSRRRPRKSPLNLQFEDRNESIIATEQFPQRWKNENSTSTFVTDESNHRNQYANTKSATLARKHSSRNCGASATEFSTSSSAERKSFGYEMRTSDGQKPARSFEKQLDGSATFTHSFTKTMTSEFLARDLLNEQNILNLSSEKERVKFYKKRYMDAYGVIVHNAKELERLVRVRVEQRDEIQALRSKVQKQSELIETLTLPSDDVSLDDSMLEQSQSELHPREKKIQELCRYIGTLTNKYEEVKGHAAKLLHERNLCVQELNQIKMNHSAMQQEVERMRSMSSMSSSAYMDQVNTLMRQKEAATAEANSLKENLRELIGTSSDSCLDIDGSRRLQNARRSFPNSRYFSPANDQENKDQERILTHQSDRVEFLNKDLASFRPDLDHSNENFRAHRNARADNLEIKTQLEQTRKELAQLRSALENTRQQLDAKKFELQQIGVEMHEKISNLQQNLHQSEKTRRRLHNKVMELKGNIRVFCRVRPLLEFEKSLADQEDLYRFPDRHGERRQIEMHMSSRGRVSYGQCNGTRNSSKRYAFNFDFIFDESCKQEDVFAEVAALIQSAVDGFNVCIFAYGQTGSGKTYTMQGLNDPDEDSISCLSAHAGIVVRALSHLFQCVSELRINGWNFTISLEMIEIYNECMRDLLALSETKEKIDIRLDDGRKLYVANICSHVVETEQAASQLLIRGITTRATKATGMNSQSSRSHCVISLRLRGRNPIYGQERTSVIHLIDLAGSERLSKSGSDCNPELLKEAQAINKSLSALGNVICALSQKAAHIPYRDSKLTHFLSTSLGGDSKALMICNLSPLPQHQEESLNSLRFAKTVNSCEIAYPSYLAQNSNR
uniref:Kinesin-like protein n=1 Tax=Albugo laibachii Nc14 TaxID=890382 RepID=F0VZG5_9STRA|nr:kinesinlike protein putative [Albugo laibachii Nc14]|eukprot:CCA14195.1 kinesinlike protein putative [Albugo laibachii Nc14]